MQRYTFVVQVHRHGVSTLENLSSAQRVRIEQLDEVGPQIERWLVEMEPRPRGESGDRDRVGG